MGSRLLFMLQYWHALQGGGLAVWLGGKTVVGGLLGGLIGVEIAKRATGWRHSTGNGFAWPLLAALIIGRIGCQLAGLSDQTYGNATSFDTPQGREVYIKPVSGGMRHSCLTILEITDH